MFYTVKQRISFDKGTIIGAVQTADGKQVITVNGRYIDTFLMSTENGTVEQAVVPLVGER